MLHGRGGRRHVERRARPARSRRFSSQATQVKGKWDAAPAAREAAGAAAAPRTARPPRAGRRAHAARASSRARAAHSSSRCRSRDAAMRAVGQRRRLRAVPQRRDRRPQRAVRRQAAANSASSSRSVIVGHAAACPLPPAVTVGALLRSRARAFGLALESARRRHGLDRVDHQPAHPEDRARAGRLSRIPASRAAC